MADSKLVECDTCGKRKSAGIVADRASCVPCAINAQMEVPIGIRRPHLGRSAHTSAGRLDEEVNEHILEFTEALVMPRRYRKQLLEEARQHYVSLDSRHAGTYYDGLGRLLVKAANRFAEGPFGVSRTIHVGEYHVNGRQLAAALSWLSNATNFGRGNEEMSEQEALKTVDHFANQALHLLTTYFGGDTYQARALFKEVVRPTRGDYSGMGRPGAMHSIKEDIGQSEIGYEYASDSGSDSGGEMIGDEQQIDWRLKVPGLKSTRFSYSTDQMADVLVIEIAKQFARNSDGARLEDSHAFAKAVVDEAAAFNSRTKRMSSYGEGQLTTRRAPYIAFLTEIGTSIAAAQKQLKHPRKPNPKKGVPGARQFLADYAKKQPNYTQFWDNLYQMLEYWEAGDRRQTFIQARDPSRRKKILSDIQNVVNRATRIVALYFEGDQDQARDLVHLQLLDAIIKLTEQAKGTAAPAPPSRAEEELSSSEEEEEGLAFEEGDPQTLEEWQRAQVEAFHNNPNR
jgi:hypothetical protein